MYDLKIHFESINVKARYNYPTEKLFHSYHPYFNKGKVATTN